MNDKTNFVLTAQSDVVMAAMLLVVIAFLGALAIAGRKNSDGF